MKRPVLIKVETTVLMEFNEEDDESFIEFCLNDSSSCISNVLSKLADDEQQCGCMFTTCTVLDTSVSLDVLEAHDYIDIRTSSKETQMTAVPFTFFLTITPEEFAAAKAALPKQKGCAVTATTATTGSVVTPDVGFDYVAGISSVEVTITSLRSWKAKEFGNPSNIQDGLEAHLKALQ